MVPLRKCLVGSLIFHMLIIAAMALFTHHSSVIRKKFLVFGAHSRNAMQVTFKSFKRHKITNKTAAYSASGVKKKVAKKQKIKKTALKKQKHKEKTSKSTPQANKKSASKSKKTIKKQRKKNKPAVKKLKNENKKSRVKSSANKKNSGKHVKSLVKKTTTKKDVSKSRQPTPDQAKKTIEQEIEKFHIDLSGSVNEEMLVYQKRIQQEVQRLWRPPLGVPKGTVCTLLVEVAHRGSIKHAELVDRSRVLIYDLSVMKVAKKFAFHKSLWGKQFKIDFRQ